MLYWIKLIGINLLVLVLLLFLVDKLLYVAGGKAAFQRSTALPPNLNDSILTVEYQTSFLTNAQGIRNVAVGPKSSGKKRILVVGDSYVFGLGVEPAQTFIAHLNRQFPDLEFINAGLPATGPMQQQYLFYQLARDYQADGLLYCSFTNDISDTPPLEKGWKKLSLQNVIRYAFSTLHYYFSLRFRRDITDSFLFYDYRQRRIDYLAMFLSKAPDTAAVNRFYRVVPDSLLQLARYSGVASFQLTAGVLAPDHLTDNLDLPTERSRAQWTNAKGVLEDILRFCRTQKMEIAACYFPFPVQYDLFWNNDTPHSAYWNQTGMHIRREWLSDTTVLQKELASFWENQSVPFFDLTENLRGHPPGAFCYSLDNHWNVQGHQKVGIVMEQWIRNNRIFD